MTNKKAPSALDRITDLELKFKTLDGEMQEITGKVNSMPSREEIVTLLQPQFDRAAKYIDEQMVIRDKGMKKYIDDSIVNGVTEGIKHYDESVAANFVTKTDAKSPAFTTSTGGTIRQQGTGTSFFDVIGSLIQKAVTEGGSGGEIDWMVQEAQSFKKLYDNDLRLRFKQFLRQSYALPSSEGHVQLQG